MARELPNTTTTDRFVFGRFISLKYLYIDLLKESHTELIEITSSQSKLELALVGLNLPENMSSRHVFTQLIQAVN